MPAWAWAIIGVVVFLAIVFVVWRVAATRRKSRHLRERFGNEYDRTVATTDSKTVAERELEAREQRRERLNIRPLSTAARDRYLDSWRSAQAEFVDSPVAAVATADALIQSVMAERGYPVKDFERRAADISVDHPDVVQNYREGHRLAQRSEQGQATTEELRMVMKHYRALFEDLVEPNRDELAA